MPTVYDNIANFLGDELQNAVKQASSLDCCVGYFNLRGWGTLAPLIDTMHSSQPAKPSRVLIGMNASESHDLLDQLDNELFGDDPKRVTVAIANQRREHILASFVQQLTRGTQSNEVEDSLQRLARQIRERKIEIRLYTRHPLHAKLYLAHFPEQFVSRVAYLGSSNLTFSGLYNNGELNIDAKDGDTTRKLLNWFEDRWSDDRCIEVTADILKIIENSWAREELVSPYHVYLKLAWHLSQDARAGISRYDIPLIFGDTLFDFQKKAVQMAARLLERRKGVFLGDVVGLGKTMMATALMKIREEVYQEDALIICPPNLVGMWESYRERYRLRGKVISRSMASKDLKNLEGYQIVLIDESHQLRNRETRDWRAIHDYIERRSSKVILLSATPYNMKVTDLSNQIRLFEDPDEDLGIRPEAAILAAGGEGAFAQKTDANMRSLRAFEESDFPDDWHELLGRYLVRRTRTHIINNYALTDEGGRKYLAMPDGTPRYFPTRVPRTAAFGTTPDLPYSRMMSEQVINRINQMELPRYGLGEYILPDIPLTPAEQETRANLGNAGNRLRGFSRTNMLKRLESSGYSFLESVRRHAIKNEIFIQCLQDDLPVPASARGSDLLIDPEPDDDRDDEQALLGIGLEDEPLDRIDFAARAHYQKMAGTHRDKFNWLPARAFNASLIKALQGDNIHLRAILETGSGFAPENDPKLIRLKKLLTVDHPYEKILVFTQYADTAYYLEKHLKSHVENLSAVSGSTGNPTQQARRFSPVSNDAEIPASSQLRVLISTDVLSEGQNLQDAHIVVNYDLPWAIIRLIQRVGRVDRIGQESPEILAYSFLPADGLEDVIKLRKRVIDRLRENAEVVGNDEKFFEGEEEQSLLHVFEERKGALDDQDDGPDDTDVASVALEIWEEATRDDPELKRVVDSLGDVVYAHRSTEPGEPDDSVIVYARTNDDVDALILMDRNENVVSISPRKILEIARCSPETLALPRPQWHHGLVKTAAKTGLSNPGLRGTSLGRRTGVRYRLYMYLEQYHKKHMGTIFYPADIQQEIPALLSALLEAPLTEAARTHVGKLLRDETDEEALIRDVITMFHDRELVAAQAGNRSGARILCTMGLVRE